MAKLSLRLFEQLTIHTTELENTRIKMESLVSSGDITVPDIERVYCGLYLSLFTEFEGTIESLFLGLLSGQYYSKTQNIQLKLKIKPSIMTQTAVFGDRNYIDWLPYNQNTIPRANIYFTNGIPFTLINTSQRDNLSEYCIIRNAIAHKSDIANQRFQRIISSLPLLPQERTPAGYLRSKPSWSSPQTQYEISSLELENIAHILCS